MAAAAMIGSWTVSREPSFETRAVTATTPSRMPRPNKTASTRSTSAGRWACVPDSLGGGAGGVARLGRRGRSPDGGLLTALGLGPLGDGPLQGRPAPGVKRIRLLVFPVLTHPARPAGGRVESTQLGQA